jgi:hypothetical protein
MSNYLISSPDKKAILNYKKYLQWRNSQIKRIYLEIKNQGKSPFPILVELTGLSWNAIWQILNYK